MLSWKPYLEIFVDATWKLCPTYWTTVQTVGTVRLRVYYSVRLADQLYLCEVSVWADHEAILYWFLDISTFSRLREGCHSAGLQLVTWWLQDPVQLSQFTIKWWVTHTAIVVHSELQTIAGVRIFVGCLYVEFVEIGLSGQRLHVIRVYDPVGYYVLSSEIVGEKLEMHCYCYPAEMKLLVHRVN